MKSASVRYVKDSEYDELVQGTDKLVIIDFMAPWCGPCKQMAPIIEEVAQEYSDELIVGTMDVDQDPEIAKKLGIRGLPTLLILKQGVEVGREIGTFTKTQLANLIETQL